MGGHNVGRLQRGTASEATGDFERGFIPMVRLREHREAQFIVLRPSQPVRLKQCQDAIEVEADGMVQ